jgi:hypothetical protein
MKDLPTAEMKTEPFHDYEKRPIVLIEYHDEGKLWMPHSLFVSHAPEHPLYCSTFDFNWSKTMSGLYYHESGSGPGIYINGWPGAKKAHAKLWWDQNAAPVLKTGGGEIVTADGLLALGFELIPTPLILDQLCTTNPFIFGMASRVIYCTKCSDHMPEDAHCDHVFWCDRCNEWGGSASDKEQCRHRKPSYR